MTEQERKYKVYIIACLIDIQEMYLTELAPEYRFKMKQLVNDSLKHTKKFIKNCDKIFTEDSANEFGKASDIIRELIEENITMV